MLTRKSEEEYLEDTENENMNSNLENSENRVCGSGFQDKEDASESECSSDDKLDSEINMKSPTKNDFIVLSKYL